MITRIQQQNEQNTQYNTYFKADNTALLDSLPKSLTPAKLFIKSQESLSVARLIQDTATNCVPKAVFTRSLADFGDMSFLEGVEDFIFYFMAPLLGQNVFSKLYPHLAPKHLKEELKTQISRSTDEILKDSKLLQGEAGKRIIPIKAGMILGCAAIPAAEYGLSFAKNLFTLKVFNKSDFNSIANLEQTQEDKQHQESLKKHSKDRLVASGVVAAVGVVIGTLFATVGHRSTLIQKISTGILTPYKPVIDLINKFKEDPLTDGQKSYIKDILNLDFRHKVLQKKDPTTGQINEIPKIKLGRGFLGLTAITGFFGYKKAAEDRGKLDVYEVCTRVPVVVLYTIFGSDVFDHIFKNSLFKNQKYTDLIKKNENNEFKDIPSLKELPDLAEQITKTKNIQGIKTDAQTELNRLIKEKAIISAIPYGFGLVFMGFLLAGITRFWTQYRYDHGQKQKAGADIIESKPQVSAQVSPQSQINNQANSQTSSQAITGRVKSSYFSWANR